MQVTATEQKIQNLKAKYPNIRIIRLNETTWNINSKEFAPFFLTEKIDNFVFIL